MKRTIPAKKEVQVADAVKMNSKYGGILKQATQANLIGHLNNIFHFKNRLELDYDKVIITNYDLDGKKIKFQKHGDIDAPDQVYVEI